LRAELCELTITFRQILLTMKTFSDTSCRENQSKHFAHINFISENHVIYEIMLDNKGYKHTIRICITFCISTTTVVTRALVNVTLYVHYLSC